MSNELSKLDKKMLSNSIWEKHNSELPFFKPDEEEVFFILNSEFEKDKGSGQMCICEISTKDNREFRKMQFVPASELNTKIQKRQFFLGNDICLKVIPKGIIKSSKSSYEKKSYIVMFTNDIDRNKWLKISKEDKANWKKLKEEKDKNEEVKEIEKSSKKSKANK